MSGQLIPVLFRRMAGALLLALLAGNIYARAIVLLPHQLTHKPEHTGHHQIESMEEQWKQALLSNNLPVIEKLLAEDYTAITANGTIETKDQVLAAHRAGKMKLLSLEISDRKIRIYGNTAVVTSRADISAQNGEQKVTGQFRYTRVYTRNNAGQWKIVSFESSRIRDPNDRDGH